MQTSRKAVRYYIDRDAGTPVIRSVPVTRPSETLAHTADSAGSQGAVASTSAESAGEYLARATRRGATRHRLASLVQSSVRKHRRQAS